MIFSFFIKIFTFILLIWTNEYYSSANTCTNLDKRCNLLRTVDLRKCRLLLAENKVGSETNSGLLKVKTSHKTKHSSPCSKIASGIKENLKGFDSQVEDVISCIISDVDRCFKNKTLDKGLNEKNHRKKIKIGKLLLYYLLGTVTYILVG
ncbi:Pv-fam-d protein [Plasmodium ovale wallikeri]|uniref:Pv-fam-d protein n=1 Tax=Plasmodium ovale wallikeri TaxID=864142 RepID=A0A1A9ANJ9_PLAOA|nr:Pv-fam-d protein [Plasmodium ovale wallikeri]SBT58423.1 Pv-fam-d protein [Plasmodium ovale wallikeri]